ncbi:MAG: hypothetical protein NVSMB52_18260 [Chloroflexota bacterium]
MVNKFGGGACRSDRHSDSPGYNSPTGNYRQPLFAHYIELLMFAPEG